MTLKEKLAELRPDYEAVSHCPDHFDFLNTHEPTSDFCRHTPCEECWNREFEPPKKSEEAEHWKDTGLIAHYSDQNKKLKDLLKAAVEDITRNQCYNDCKTCALYDIDRGSALCDGRFKWRYAEEFEKLLGGEE